MSVLRGLVIFLGLIGTWQALVWLTGVPPYILPDPPAVVGALAARGSVVAENAGITILEILLGLTFGTGLGVTSALLIAAFRPVRRWLQPVLVVSQAMPVFALAPLLVLWFGYGLASKVAMATLIIYFPVATAFTDGLRRTDPGWLDLARTMGGSRLAVLRVIRIPAALPALASGLRVATAVAPIGAIIGEWVGSGAGLGYLMLRENARMQIDLVFAALFVLAVFVVLLYFTVDRLLRRALSWQAEEP